MQVSKGNLFTRDDTVLGVCQGLGEDLGFNPLWLRIAFAVGVYLNPMVAVGSYFGLGLIVLTTRLIIREPRRAAPALEAQPAVERVAANADDPAQELAVAA
jgi:phage shock protein PspC (stress-responsive transcriptional regulator)